MSDHPLAYRLYDRLLLSPHPLALSPSDQGPAPDPRLPIMRLEEGPIADPAGQLVHDVVDFDGIRRLKVWLHPARGVIFSYGDARIQWNSSTATIRLQRGDLPTRPAITLERMAAPIAITLEQPRYVALHASAVADRQGRAWIFAGHSGVGKSTTALGLLRRGLSIVADDLVLYDVHTQRALVATPSLRLFDRPEEVPEAIEDELVMPHLQKYWYRLPDHLPQQRPAPEGIALHGIFLLTPDHSASRPQVERLRGQAALVAILSQAFDLSDALPQWRTDRFRALSQLARKITIYRVTYRQNDRSSPEQVRLILETIDE